VIKEDFDAKYNYCPDTGLITKKLGGVVNKPNNVGYLVVNIGRTKYLAHRAIYLHMTGELPEFIDHIDGNRLNNKWSNLRAVTSTDNNRNCKISSTNKTGVIGVCWSVRDCVWRATIGANSRQVGLGTFRSFFDAVCARRSAELYYKYHENHGRLV
jgi:hypothetical protein